MTATRRTHGAKTLAAKFYMSEEIFGRETERIFSRHWLCAGRASEIAAPGDYLLLELDGESLIVLRDRDGQVRCFYNVCRHRGTRLCQGSGGNVGKAIGCPYHGWTY